MPEYQAPSKMTFLSSSSRKSLQDGNVSIIRVENECHIQEVRILFQEYQRSLNVDLGFQDFEHELSSLPGEYQSPHGILLLATVGEEIAGCVALRRLEDEICEMKRLYVRSGFRGLKLGRRLAETVIREAIRIGYRLMRLDTLETLIEAMHLYDSLGFKRVAPYYPNPLPGVVYWELDLLTFGLNHTI